MHRAQLLRSIFLVLSCASFTANAAPAAPPSAEGVLVDDRAVMGEWGGVIPWPDKAVHSILLRTGKVLWYRGEGGTVPTSYTWDPATNTLESQPIGFGVFCSGQAVLPDGRVVVTGGRLGTTGSLGPSYSVIFDPIAQQWSRGPDMHKGRYYPTNIVIGDGRLLTISGYDNTHTINETVEAFHASTGPGDTERWDILPGADHFMPYYPRFHLLPSGKIFHVGKDAGSETLDPATSVWQPVATSNYGNRAEGTSVILPPGFDRIMIIGGGSSTNTAEIIDLTATPPAWTYAAPMTYGRSHLNNVILPDGTVLVAGGGSGSSPVYPGEIYDPATGTWKVVASMHTYRMYHSSALLLPDGRCVWAGTDGNNTAEVYSPPYLFRGPRPVIDSSPAAVQYGESFRVHVANAASIGSVVVLRPGATTHSQNMEQRYVPMSFELTPEGALSVRAPSNPNIAPPGYYMLFVLDRDKVPSVAKFVHLGGTAAPVVDNDPPRVTLGAPNGGESWGIGSAHDITWTATDDVSVSAVDLAYSTDGGGTFPNVIATGIANTGTFAWTVPATLGSTARVRVTAHDAVGHVARDSSDANFTITSGASGPAVLVTAPNGAESWVSGSHHAITWTAQGINPVVSVDIVYSTDGGATFPNVIATGISNTGTFDWLVPGPVGAANRVRVTARDSNGNSANDASNANFKILDGEPPTVTVEAPDQGNVWNIGSSRSITWAASDNVGVTRVDLAYSTNSGASFPNVIATNLANTGQYAWTVPNAPSTTARVRVFVRDAAGNVGSDSTEADFSIVDEDAPQVRLITPNGGEHWGKGSVQSIVWSATDNAAVSAIDLAYSTDDGATFPNGIARAIANTGSFAWTLPSTLDSTVRVRVTAHDAAGHASSAESNTSFSIVEDPNLVDNASFESGVGRWMPYGSAALTLANEGNTGGHALKVAGTAATSFGCDDNPDWINPVAAKGAVYRIAAWVKTSTASRGSVKIRVYEYLGTTQQGTTAYSQVVPLTATWTRLSLDYTVRTAGSRLSIRVTDAPIASGETFLVDDVSIKLLTGSGAPPPNAAPIVTAPPTVAATAGVPISFTVSASDPDGPALVSLTQSGKPAAASFVENPTHTSGAFTWTPTAADVRTAPYAVTFTATNTKSGSATTNITVGAAPPTPANLCGNPDFETGTAGWGPYGNAVLSVVPGGITGNALQISGSSSFGCDDLPTDWVAGPLTQGAVYRVSAWVKSATGATGTVKIRVYELLGTTQQGTTAYSQQLPLTSDWRQLTIDYTVRVAGTHLSIRITDAAAAGTETYLVDNVQITRLSAAAPVASNPLAGERSRAEGLPAAFSASFSPNPLEAEGTLSFGITRPGYARVELFDANGRRVRNLMDERRLEPGRHHLRVDLRGEGGRTLPAGLYFYRIQAAEGVLRGRFVLMR